MNKLYYFERKSSITWICIFVIFMTIFTFYDLPIAKAVFHYNDTYGEIFKIIGLLPTCVAGIFYAISNLVTRKIARRPIISAILSAASLLLFVGFTLLSVYHLNRSIFVPVIIFCVIFIIISIAANYDLCRKVNLFDMRKVMIIALVSALVAVGGQTLIKFAFNRPRFITLSDPDTQFTYWFVHFPFALDSSFPSGHSAQAALCFLLMYFKRFIPRLRTKAWDIALCTFAVFITVSTMFARMFLGAHYATDVWAGCFLTLTTISLMNQYVERSYMIPEYRVSNIRERLLQLKDYTKDKKLLEAYDSILKGMEVADNANDKKDHFEGLLRLRDDIDTLLLNEKLSRREIVSLNTIRKFTDKFIDEIKLKNFDEIYTVTSK